MDLKNIPTRFYIDYKTTLELCDHLGKYEFLNFLDRSSVIALDEKAYSFIMRLQNSFKDDDFDNQFDDEDIEFY